MAWRLIPLIVVASSMLVAAAGVASAQQAEGLQAEEERIRQLGEQWLEAVRAGDHETAGGMYAEHGVVMPPNAALAEGVKAGAEFWKGVSELPSLAITWAPTRIDVAEAADMAYEIGTFTLSFDTEEGPVEDEGKYVVVWIKEGGAWKAAADIFNSDRPAE